MYHGKFYFEESSFKLIENDTFATLKEFTEENTTIRIHNDYINTDEQNKTNEIIISLMINTLKNKNN